VESALASQMAPRAPGEESAVAPARVSIKALNPEDRARTVQALDLIRAGRAPADAFAEAFGITGQAQPQTHEADGFAQERAADFYAAADSAPGLADAPQVAELEHHLSVLQQ